MIEEHNCNHQQSFILCSVISSQTTTLNFMTSALEIQLALYTRKAVCQLSNVCLLAAETVTVLVVFIFEQAGSDNQVKCTKQ